MHRAGRGVTPFNGLIGFSGPSSNVSGFPSPARSQEGNCRRVIGGLKRSSIQFASLREEVTQTYPTPLDLGNLEGPVAGGPPTHPFVSGVPVASDAAHIARLPVNTDQQRALPISETSTSL